MMLFENRLTGFLPHLREALSRAMDDLLRDRQIYKSVEVDAGFIKTVAFRIIERNGAFPPVRTVGAHTPQECLEREAMKLIAAPWITEGEAPTEGESKQLAMDSPIVGQHISFPLPVINMLCSQCHEQTSFKADGLRCRSIYGKSSGPTQSFLFTYECQGCRKDTATFLVKRRGLVLQLTGTDPTRLVSTEVGLPPSVSRYYKEAQIAQRSGRTLAAIILMQRFIEEFLRSLPELKGALAQNPSMSTDDVADVYATQLPLEFNAHYPSLKNCYRALGEALRANDPDPVIFNNCLRDVHEHLDARRFHRISRSSLPESGVASAGLRGPTA